MLSLFLHCSSDIKKAQSSLQNAGANLTNQVLPGLAKGELYTLMRTLSLFTWVFDVLNATNSIRIAPL